MLVAVAPTVPADRVLHLLDDDTVGRLTGPRRDRSASAHALLRLLLSELTGAQPRDHVLDRWCGSCGGPHGKPLLRGWPLHVSVATTSGTVAAAVTGAGAVGVDVELHASADFARFAEVALGPDEEARTPATRARAWVRKEAVLKATGTGLSVDPRRVDVRADVIAGPPVIQIADVAVSASLSCAVAVVARTPLDVRLVERSLPS